MVPITGSNVHQHELIGLPANVIYSSNPCQVGISGFFVDESMNTMTISNGIKDRIIQKKGARFNVTLVDGSKITVEGYSILSRPIERVKGKNRGS
ncbi:ribonuclease P protein subunit [Candidatus Bathyarchaeota archaeon]|nr:ribonuclease P protein subunit [Candidatus Bathyarchaeota archaeon]